MCILKFLIAGTTIADLEYVTKSVQSSNTQGCCTDGTHVFSIHAESIEKFLCSDMSLVDDFSVFNGSDSFTTVIGITTDGTYFYVTDGSGSNGRVVIFNNSDMSYVGEFPTDMVPQGIDHDGSKLYVSEMMLLG
jgi:hypothetical protein